MNIYMVRHDVENYESYDFPELTDPLEINNLFTGQPMVCRWKPLRVRFCSEGDRGRTLPQADFPNLYRHVMVMTDRAKQCLQRLLQKYGEFLPLNSERGPYYAFNVTCAADALDYDQSHIARFTNNGRIAYNYEKSHAERYKNSGRVAYITKYVLKKISIPQAPIFKIRGLETHAVFCSDLFRDEVARNNLTGLMFEPVEVLEPGEKAKPANLESPRTSGADKTNVQPKVQERDLTANEKHAIADALDQGANMLAIGPATATPDDVQQRIYNEINRIRDEYYRYDSDDLDEIAAALGSLWGESVCDAMGWEWRVIKIDDYESIAVVSTSRSCLVFPVEYISELLKDPDRDHTSLLLYNMIKKGGHGWKESSYTVIG